MPRQRMTSCANRNRLEQTCSVQTRRVDVANFVSSEFGRRCERFWTTSVSSRCFESQVSQVVFEANHDSSLSDLPPAKVIRRVTRLHSRKGAQQRKSRRSLSFCFLLWEYHLSLSPVASSRQTNLERKMASPRDPSTASALNSLFGVMNSA